MITISHYGDAAEPCACANCAWTGPVSALAPCDDADVTAGDVAPVGRCPEDDCGALCYLARPVDLAMDAARLAYYASAAATPGEAAAQ